MRAVEARCESLTSILSQRERKKDSEQGIRPSHVAATTTYSTDNHCRSLAALAEFGERARIYAGGAELLLLMRHGLLESEILVDVKKIDRLHQVAANHNSLRVGACVTHRELEAHPLVRQHAPSFAYAESQVANVRVRNQGTLGGNLAFNDPHSDPGTVLLIHDATVNLGQ